MKPQLLIACDFDGTITRQDTLVEILNRYGSPTWTSVQDKVVSGEVSIREGLKSEMGSVRASRAEIERLLEERVQLDPTFPGFLRQMRERGVPVVLVTGGFDLCIQTVMAQAGLWPVPYLANRLIPKEETWQVDFPYPSNTCTACGHCKGDPVRNWRAQGYTTVFAGNGVTDRCAAMAASLTFAKDELETWCRREAVPAVRFGNFDDIQKELRRREWL
ncbi:MAG: HAD-IB family phosphatase [Candidatus Omnitrophota bacterium]|nr:HAD-IB family phosphatase [Candidatus Omnitrophota bacterium]